MKIKYFNCFRVRDDDHNQKQMKEKQMIFYQIKVIYYLNPHFGSFEYGSMSWLMVVLHINKIGDLMVNGSLNSCLASTVKRQRDRKRVNHTKWSTLKRKEVPKC